MSPAVHTPEAARALGARSVVTRRRKAGLKRKLKRGELRLPDVVLSPPRELAPLPVYRLLVSTRAVQDTKARRIIRTASIAAGRELKDVPVRDLGPRERRILIGAYVRHSPSALGARR